MNEHISQRDLDADGTWSFKKPDLSAFPATDDERRVAELYTRIRFVLVDEETPNAHTAWLVIGNQAFCDDDYKDDEDAASWHCWMYAKALLHFLGVYPAIAAMDASDRAADELEQ